MCLRDSDWFRIQTIEDTLLPSIDLILNMAMFLWLGVACPWASFVDGSVIPTHRLFLLGALVLLLRRLPVIFALRRLIPQISGNRDVIFMGFFGPIGISAIFYCYLGCEFLQSFAEEKPGAVRLQEQLKVVVWFLVTASIVSVIRTNCRTAEKRSGPTPSQVVHGISIPLAKSWNFLSRNVSGSFTRESPLLHI
jgi:NhaP-type Na+/H+ or K+/H+ antiporter